MQNPLYHYNRLSHIHANVIVRRHLQTLICIYKNIPPLQHMCMLMSL